MAEPKWVKNVALIPIDLIDPNPDNPRIVMTDLSGLAETIRTKGFTTPCMVRVMPDKRFRLLAGHRRVLAAKMAGLESVPCVVRSDVADGDEFTIMLLENIQRADLNPVEEARAFRRILDAEPITQLQLAQRLGVSEPRVSRRLALLDLSAEQQDMVLRGKMSMSDAWEAARLLKRRKGPEPGAANAGRGGRYDVHFNRQHPLYQRAADLCKHRAWLLTEACGSCWETVVRADEIEKWAETLRTTRQGQDA